MKSSFKNDVSSRKYFYPAANEIACYPSRG